MIFARIHRIAIAYAQYAGFTFELEGQQGTGIWHQTTFLVLYLNGDDSEVTTVGSDLLTISL